MVLLTVSRRQLGLINGNLVDNIFSMKCQQMHHVLRVLPPFDLGLNLVAVTVLQWLINYQ